LFPFAERIMRGKALAGLLVLLLLAPPGSAQPGDVAPGAGPPAVSKPQLTAARLANAAEVRKRLGLAPDYDNVPGIESVKVAVLDYGFDGVDRRPYLPDGAVVVEHYDPDLVRRFHLGDPDYRKGFEPGNRHGRTMAQIVWAVTGAHPGGPKFYLLNANGPTMLRRAVRYAIEQKVDVILFSGAFEGAGNGDGRGPINRAVADALAAGILWVNAAGNYGHRVYSGPVRLDSDSYLRFRDGADGTALRFRNRLDENTVTVTLTWNDYREQEDAGTDKDLDLYVEDPTGKQIGAGAKTQVAGDREAGPDESRNPRERVVLTDLPANLDLNYRIRVRAKTNNFTWDDRIRVLVSATRDAYVDPATGRTDEGVTFFDASGKEELYPPADNPLVLTVGDTDSGSAVGPTADHRLKPDVLLEDSRAFFSDGEVTAGSSNAAAYLAGVVAVLKAAEPGLQARHLLLLAQQEAGSRPAATPRPAAARPAESVLDRGMLPGQSGIPLPRPVAAAPQPQPQPRVLFVGPLGRTRIILVPRQTTSAEAVPAPRPPAEPAPEVLPSPRPVTSLLEGRLRRTPSRARLAELVRTDR
jgi:hypothetical protein